MSIVHKPIEVYIDNEDFDDGFYNLGFVMNREVGVLPHHVGLCRDFIEEPDYVYIEADDQIYGFLTNQISYEIKGTLLTITLLDEHVFYWNKEKTFTVEFDIINSKEIKHCLEVMCNFESV